MDNNNWRPSLPNGEAGMDNSGDWRTQLPPDSRQKIVNKIMETLKKHLPFSGPEGINELRRIAARFEEKIFSGASNQTDYLMKISMKMLTMETKSQNAAGSASSIPAANNGSSMDSMPTNQGHLLPGTLPNNQYQAPQPLLSQTMQSNTASGMTGSTALPSSMPPVSSITNNNVTSVANNGSSMDSRDWRNQLSWDSRQKNLDKLMETLKEHVPYSGEEGINELMRIAVSFEDLIFNTAINQADYFHKISLKMQTIEGGN